MTQDLEGVLRRVVLAQFDESVDVAWEKDLRPPRVFRANLRSGNGAEGRNVSLSASTSGVFHLDILAYGVGTALTEYDDEEYMEAILRSVARVADAYLSGEGQVEYRRGLLRKRPVLTISVDGSEWRMGRRASSRPYPDDSFGEAGDK